MLNPKEKAEELCKKVDRIGKTDTLFAVKEYAILTINEILEVIKNHPAETQLSKYWYDVISEIKKI